METTYDHCIYVIRDKHLEMWKTHSSVEEAIQQAGAAPAGQPMVILPANYAVRLYNYLIAAPNPAEECFSLVYGAALNYLAADNLAAEYRLKAMMFGFLFTEHPSQDDTWDVRDVSGNIILSLQIVDLNLNPIPSAPINPVAEE